MVKAGVYWLPASTRSWATTALWSQSLLWIGGISMLSGDPGRPADRPQADPGLDTVSGLGTLFFLLGMGSPAAVTAALKFLPTHALYQGALFMVAGAVSITKPLARHPAHRRSRGDAGHHAGRVLAAFSQPGCRRSWLHFEGDRLQGGTRPAAPGGGGRAGHAFIVAVAAVILFEVFFGPSVVAPRAPHDGPAGLWLGALVLSVLGIAISVRSVSAVRAWSSRRPTPRCSRPSTSSKALGRPVGQGPGLRSACRS